MKLFNLHILTRSGLESHKRQAIKDYLKLRGSKDKKLSTETDVNKIIELAVKGVIK